MKNSIDTAKRFKKIRNAVAERDSFLAEHPELQPLQEEIERRLRGAGSVENRIAILRFMMDEKLFELRRACLKAKESWKV